MCPHRAILEASQFSGFCRNHAPYSPMGGGVGEGGSGPGLGVGGCGSGGSGTGPGGGGPGKGDGDGRGVVGGCSGGKGLGLSGPLNSTLEFESAHGHRRT
jgi:hypothetical protein